MMYKDKDKQKEAVKRAVCRRRLKPDRTSVIKAEVRFLMFDSHF